MKGSPLDASDETLAQFLWNRRGAVCTMCGCFMEDGYCVDVLCPTYPSWDVYLCMLDRFNAAIEHTHRGFKKRTSLKPTHSKVVSGGRVESKRRKH
jgi:hypothetical protein